MKKKVVSIVLTFVVALGVLAGCTTTGSTTVGNSTPETTDEQNSESDADAISVADLDPTWMEVQSAEESGEQLKVAFSVMNVTNDNYMKCMADTVQEYVEGLGHEFVLSVASASWSAPISMQVNAIEDLISADIDVLLFHAFDANALVPVIQKCNDAGIVCISVDAKLADDNLFLTYIGADNKTLGKTAAEGLLEDYSDDIEKYIVMNGSEGNPSTLDRAEGFKEYMEENAPEAECVGDYFANADNDTAMTYVQNALVSDPDLDAIYTVTDTMINGIIQALEQAGKEPGEVKLVGNDGVAYVVSEIEEGWVTGDVLAQAQDIILTGAQIGISAKQDMLKEENIPKTIHVTCPYVDVDNLDEMADSFY